MRKASFIVLTLILSASLCGCGAAPADEPPLAPDLDIQQPGPQTDDGTQSGGENGSALLETAPSGAPESEDSESAELFRTFLAESYEELIAVSFNNIAGLGFVDLDLDGSREMVVFDAGASASMGVNIFDIIDGNVECISANMLSIGEAFGGRHLSAVSISANFMEDFRLMESAGGERFFTVKSFNGNDEFFFDEQIRFSNHNGALALTSLSYKYEEFNSETGEITKQLFKLGGADASADDYNAFFSRFISENTDTGLECQGFFVWEISDYNDDFVNFMSVVDKALELSSANTPPAR